MVGAIAQAKGVQTLQPFVLALVAAIAILWFVLPRGSQKDREDSRQELEGQI